MEQFEKVRKGLRCHSDVFDEEPDCEHCEYDNANCGLEVPSDALALIRQQQARIAELEAAQTARVMSLEEVFKWVNTPVSEQKPIYWEKRTGRCENGWKCDYHSVNLYLLVRNGCGRCWTQRPTDEQRKATLWE